MLPFYHADTHRLRLKPDQADKVNLGLFFDRFFDWKRFDVTDSKHIKAKKNFLAHFKLPSFGNKQHIARVVLKQMQLNQALPSISLCMCSDWHWVSGLGNSHPLESGFSWHHTLAMPYLPGSSVKGVLRAYCEVNGMAKTQLRQWFGSESKDSEQCEQENQAGELIFFDALPCSLADILPDVVAVHSGDWHARGDSGNTAPADWHNPKPISFLVAKNFTLFFSVALSAHSTLNVEVLDEVKALLEQALGVFGAGAKTATGYGTMSIDLDSEKTLNQMLQSRLEELA